MKAGDQLSLTDGKGTLLTAEITNAHKKHCEVTIVGIRLPTPDYRLPTISIAISLLKNPSRFEWFLEKATELGISEIIPLLCERTEKEKFRHERMQQICISAMLQSQQVWLPVLHQPIAFSLLFRQEEVVAKKQKFIAHCDDDTGKNQLSSFQPFDSGIILIGPEGDFTRQEIELALENNFLPVALGPTRLRSETAGIVAAALLCIS